jgi:hypothetical protein
MSSLYSDPPFSRGGTLLADAAIDLDVDGNPIAGREIVGQVKAFRDINPYSGQVYSNRLVYCVAARFKPSNGAAGNLDQAGVLTARGTVYAFTLASPMAEFAAAATNANVAAGVATGVLDEYLTGTLRLNDIVWVVIKGPTSIKQTAVAINTGLAVEVSATAGSVMTVASGAKIGQQIAGANSTAAVQLTRVTLWGVNHSD